jgi:hypothetical protein
MNCRSGKFEIWDGMREDIVVVRTGGLSVQRAMIHIIDLLGCRSSSSRLISSQSSGHRYNTYVFTLTNACKLLGTYMFSQSMKTFSLQRGRSERVETKGPPNAVVASAKRKSPAKALPIFSVAWPIDNRQLRTFASRITTATTHSL